MLKEYVARGTYIYPPQASLRIVTDIFAFCEREVPQWNTISISGYHIREAGSTAVQEVAFTFANAIAYVQAAIDAGLDVNDFGQRLSFFFNAHNDFLEEVAKFRAARRLWARLMRDRFGATNPRAQQLRFHTQTAGSTLTAQQPDNNIVRVALQALAAVLGGTQSLHTNGRDEALALPTEDVGAHCAQTQQIIAHETGVANTVDPVRRLVRHRAADQRDRRRRATSCCDRIDALGGTLAGDRERVHPAADSGVGLQGATGDRRGRVGRGRREPIPDRRADRASRSSQLDPELEREQIDRVQCVARGRDSSRVENGARRGRVGRARGRTTSCRAIISAVEAQRHRRRDRGHAAQRLRRISRGEPRLATASRQPETCTRQIWDTDAASTWRLNPSSLSKDLTTVFDLARLGRSSPWTMCRSRSAKARRSAWSANRAAANP